MWPSLFDGMVIYLYLVFVFVHVLYVKIATIPNRTDIANALATSIDVDGTNYYLL